MCDIYTEIPGVFLTMTYNLVIDQEFALQNNLTLTQVSTLAAFFTLPTWANTIALDGNVWYQYSEEKMAEDFPLLFSVAKRCYKNLSELAQMGFVEITKVGRSKYVRFTSKCSDWGKEKVQKRTESPKTDSKKSENGLNVAEKSPKTDFDTSSINYNINKTNNINIKDASGGLFSSDPNYPVVVTKPRRTSEPNCLFADSKFADYDKFAAEFTAEEFKDVDICYYYNAVSDWSSRFGKKQKDWIATARNFMRNDNRDGKLVKLNKGGLDPDAMEYLREMAD